ncbi:hypothetical protein [Micromonospora aurantiaca (nom. illeg.)]|uniref:hypothetical protein n=1 Tax=Micromonospora aurantiaca (nom. illeg.) TaxID=47850 RepID=UPI00341D0CE9
MAATVFPAAAPEPADDRQHPQWCACPPCTADMLASITRPLIQGGVAVDRALLARNSSPAGFTETRTRRLSRPGSNQPQAPVGEPGVGGQGVAGLGRPATPAPGGAR